MLRLSFDATKEHLNLELAALKELDLAHAGRAPWSVMVSTQRFLWTFQPEPTEQPTAPDPGETLRLPWYYHEPVRPSVAVLSTEFGENIVGSTHFLE